MRSFLRWTFGFVILVVAATLLAAGGLAWATLPGGDRQVRIEGLTAPVAIDIDVDGIPRIHAASDLDAAAALGYLHARDRMFQMDLMRRAASGRLSEIAGAATLPIDRQMRTLGVLRSATADLAALPPATRAILDAYARGVNARIAERGRFIAAEFLPLGAPEPWSAVDSLLWGKTMGLYLSANWRTELARLAASSTMSRPAVDALWPPIAGGGHPEARLVPRPSPELAEVAAQLAKILPSFPAPFTQPQTASNAWAVDGAHSETGAPLLAGDPHLGFSLPGIWYLARIDTPGGVLAGATAPGVPFLVLGRNLHIAWTFTTTGADVQDLFVETKVGDDQYQTPDGPKPFVTRTERIAVRGAPDDIWTVRETRHGPVISDLVAPEGPILALSMANLAPGDTAATGLLALNHATSVAEAGQAAAMISAPVQNLMVADQKGIGLFVTGRVPIRRGGDGAWPAGGASGAFDWTGFASGNALPHYVDPASGRLVNANERVAPADFPVFLGRDWFDDLRAQRIRQRLDQSARHSVAEFAAIQLDHVDLLGRELAPMLSRVPAAEGLARQALGLLAGWDGSTALDLPQPLIFNAWMPRFADAVLTRAHLPPRARAAAAPWPQLVMAALLPPNGEAPALAPGGTLCGRDCTSLLATTLAETVADLADRFGSDPSLWSWGLAHQAVFAHPLLRALPVIGAWSTARIAAPGDDSTIDRGAFVPDTFDAVHGASYRGVYDLADLDRSRFIVAPGQSGHIISALARNFLQRWRDGRTIMLGPAADRVDTRINLLPSPAVAKGAPS
jgi:penicillin amidase